MDSAPCQLLEGSGFMDGNEFMDSAHYRLLRGNEFIDSAPYRLLKGSRFLTSALNHILESSIKVSVIRALWDFLKNIFP